MKRIKIDIFNPKSIDRAIEELKALDKQVDSKTERAVNQIAEITKNKVSVNYYSAEKDVPVDSDYSVSSLKTGKNERTVLLSGHSVLFEEFGTGITKSDSPSARSEIKDGEILQHGEYGKGQGANPNGWILNGKHTFGIDAQTPMYSAKKEVGKDMANIAKDVFESD